MTRYTEFEQSIEQYFLLNTTLFPQKKISQIKQKLLSNESAFKSYGSPVKSVANSQTYTTSSSAKASTPTPSPKSPKPSTKNLSPSSPKSSTNPKASK